MPMLELERQLLAEFVANPVLEEAVPIHDADMPVPQQTNDSDSVDGDDDYSTNISEADHWSDELPLPGTSSTAADSDIVMELLGNAPAPMPSLYELLLTEIEAAEISPALRRTALEIINTIDDDGYLTINPADLAMVCDCSIGEVEEALQFVQSVAPPGVGARDLAELFKLQLRAGGELTPLMEKLLDEGLNDIEKNRLPQLAEKLGITISEVESLISTLRKCDPAPGKKFQRSRDTAVTPELEIVKNPESDTFYVRSLRDNYRRVMVSPLYEKMAASPDLNAEDRQYLNEKLAKARELVKALEMRDSTLLQLAKFIAANQEDFLRGGVEKLKAVTMHDAAAALDVVDSTISRAVADKYITTPQGIFPLRYFFTASSAADSSGELLAGKAVMEKLRQLVKAENPLKPYSDAALAEMLQKSGVNIARRTVAKYRDILDIPPAALRKKFQ